MIYVGIDVAKKKFYYCIIDIELKIIKRGIIINNNNGFIEFLRIIRNYGNIQIGKESKNIYHVNLYNYLIGNNYNAIILNSMETKLMKDSRIRKNKTDKIDAESIAKYIIIRKNNIMSMDENTKYNKDKYADLKEYAYTYLRINKKITMVNGPLHLLFGQLPRGI